MPLPDTYISDDWEEMEAPTPVPTPAPTFSSAEWEDISLPITPLAEPKVADYGDIIGRASEMHKVDPALIRSLIKTESAFNPKAVSPRGAQGLTQLMPDTAKELGVTDPFDPEQNIMAGTKYLAQNLERFGGDISLALAAYNAGARNVEEFGGIPAFPETQKYIGKVLEGYEKYKKPPEVPPEIPSVETSTKEILRTIATTEEPPSFIKEVIKPTLKEVGRGMIATPEAAYTLLEGMIVWPISVTAGLTGLVAGGEEMERRQEATARWLTHKPIMKEAAEAGEVVGKGFEFLETPQRMASEELKRRGYHRLAYVVKLVSDLAMFKILHAVGTKAKGKIIGESIPKDVPVSKEAVDQIAEVMPSMKEPGIIRRPIPARPAPIPISRLTETQKTIAREAIKEVAEEQRVDLVAEATRRRQAEIKRMKRVAEVPPEPVEPIAVEPPVKPIEPVIKPPIEPVRPLIEPIKPIVKPLIEVPFKMVQRIEEKGKGISDATKPQGLYTTPLDVISPHKLGGIERKFEVQAKTPLDVSGELDVLVKSAPSRRTPAGNAIPASSGIKALRELVSETEFERLAGMDKATLLEHLNKEYPDVKWDRYTDMYEALEGYAGLLARKAGYDAIIDIDTVHPEFSEFVALERSAIKPVAKPPVEPLVKPIVEPARPPIEPVRPLVEPERPIVRPPIEPIITLAELREKPELAEYVTKRKATHLEEVIAEAERIIKPEEPVPVEKVKEPWEMTKEEFVPRTKTIGPDTIKRSAGTLRIGKDGIVEILREIKTSDISVRKENKIYAAQVEKYKKTYSNQRPVVMIKKDGRIVVDDGHHRFIADKDLGKKTSLVWVRDATDYPRSTTHKFAVQQALKEGKPVPEKVLAEYPELKIEPIEPVVKPEVPKVPIPEKPAVGLALRKGEEVSFSEYREIKRGKNKGRVRVTWPEGKWSVIDKADVLKWPERVKVIIPEKAGPRIFRMIEPTKVVNTRGKEITLPRGEEFMAYDIGKGKIRLQDGKQVTIYEGKLSKLRGQMLPPGEEPMAGGMGRIGRIYERAIGLIRKSKKEKGSKKQAEAAELVKDEFNDAYEKQEDIWFKKTDSRLLSADVEKRLLQKELKIGLKAKRYGKVTRNIDRAIQIYIDTKRNPEHIKEYWDKLTPEQQKTVTLSQNLPDAAKKIADKIDKSYREIGLEALDAQVIHNTLDNYAARIWDLSGKEAREQYRKFGIKTHHAKRRKLDTIIEGWATGLNLKVSGATNNLNILKHEIIKTIEDKRFLNILKETTDIEGNPLITTKRLEGYKRIEHPNFTTWKWTGTAAKVTSGPHAGEYKTYGKNFFVGKEGALFERQVLYAPEKQAGYLNNVLGVSKLKKVPGIHTITKYNALTKAWILQTSFFHHLAFARSYYFGTQGKKWSELNIKKAYKEGLEGIENLQPEIKLGVENGLTLGLKQDWSETLLREKTLIGKWLDKTKTTKAVKDSIINLRERQAEWLFGEFGAGLKAKSFLIEYRHQLKKYPNTAPDILAKRVARLINDDFGGLHLRRLRRNPTLQHIFRLFALAPDWTESNVRTMVKAIRSGEAAESRLYRRFWAGVLVKGGLATVAANWLMAGGDLEEMKQNYIRAWKVGNLKTLGVDIMPVYKLLGGSSEDRKYFTIFGHFRDPLKFIIHPIRSAHHKGSVAYGVFHEALAGTDWKGHKFTTISELIQERRTVKWGPGGPINWEQFPSYLLSQIIGMQPIQVQNLIAWASGEVEGFNAVANSLGLAVTTGRIKGPIRRRGRGLTRRTRRGGRTSR